MGDRDDVLPASFIDTPAPNLLWASLQSTCIGLDNACDALVIPHNSNYSAGSMFTGLADDGGTMSLEYATTRASFEPLVEIMQHKGSSECYFQAGVIEDELCAFTGARGPSPDRMDAMVWAARELFVQPAPGPSMHLI